jgi:hypothetical protein
MGESDTWIQAQHKCGEEVNREQSFTFGSISLLKKLVELNKRPCGGQSHKKSQLVLKSVLKELCKLFDAQF